jgi:hypothetical protein
MSTPRSTSHAISAALALLLAVIMLLAIQLIGTLRAHQRMTVDLAEINDIKYGLLNADAWMQQVTAIIEKKIREFELTPENRKTIKPILEHMLNTLIAEVDHDMHKQKISGPWLERTTDRIKHKVQDALIDMKQIKAEIPQYADKILDQMEKPEARRELKKFIQDMLKGVSRSTFAEVDEGPIETIHTEYQCQNRPSCQQSIVQRIDLNHVRALQQMLTLLALTTLLFIGVSAAPDKKDNNRLWLLAVCCTVLMLCGVLTPMIDVQAQVAQLRFILLGEPVIFANQVLYFQSKSVLDMVHVLVATGKPDMILVGILITTFSVVFPLAKLLASLVYLYDPQGLRQSAITQFFALKSGKWSMADVFVVAMFMAYVGFNGVIANQLSEFSAAGGPSVDVLTTNGTSLQIGFFMFLAFCIANLVTSSLIDSAIQSDAGHNGLRKNDAVN